MTALKETADLELTSLFKNSIKNQYFQFIKRGEKMKRSVVTLPDYAIGADVYQKAGSFIKKYGRTAVIIGGKRAMSAAGSELTDALKKDGIAVLGQVWFGGDSTYENVDMLTNNDTVKRADVVLAVGGGKCCDTCKVVAERLDKPLFTFPTISSNCAPCTALAIMYNADGSFKDNFYSVKPPLCVFINDKIIANSPIEYLQAGIGDALSKEAEVALALRHVRLDQNLLVGKALCAACTEPLLQYGEEALKSCREKRTSQALQEVILDIVISTGLVSNMTVCPEFYYNTNLAHCFYYGATIFPVSHQYLHGFLVAFGVLILLDYDGQTELRDRVMRFYRQTGLPVTLAEVGLTRDDLPALIEKATHVPGWHVDNYELSAEKFHDSILHVDDLGKTLN